jgi:hypothetical protein
MASTSSAEETAASAPVAPASEQKPAGDSCESGPPSEQAMPPEQAIQGFIERIEPQRVSGWAWDRLAPEVHLEVEIVLDGKILATTHANRFREDLKSGTGDGCHAFQAFLDDPLPEQMKHRIIALARVRHDGPATRLVNLVGDRVGDPLPESPAAVATPVRQANTGHVAAGPRQRLVNLAAADRELQAANRAAFGEIHKSLAAVAATAAAVAETAQDLRATQEHLVKQLAALEVFQVRFDATLQGMEDKTTVAGGGGRPDHGLRAAVTALAVISTASLALGLWSLIGG